jgi:valine dehydrogenase (NAD+)
VDITFERIPGHEQVVFAHDESVGLSCIVAIHSTALGPALGGTRFRAYPSLGDALEDVLRLSRAMTSKNACAGLDHGGGKAVIVGDPAATRSEGLLRAYARVVDSLGGRYVTACDVGTTPADMAVIGRETRWATGADEVDGGSGDSGVLTAHGVYLAMRVAARAAFGNDGLGGKHIAIQGLGKVGARLARRLSDDGARLSVADVDPAAVGRVADLPGVEVVDPEDVLEVDADIVSPNALGAVLDERRIARIQARVVCGGANNQLVTDDDALRLHDRGVLYAPDFVVNAGGVINVAEELHPRGYSAERAHRRAEVIPATLDRVIDVSRTQGIDTRTAAERVAEARIATVGGLRRFLLPH